MKINGGRNRIKYYSKLIKEDLSDEFIFKIHERKQFHYLETIQKSCVKLKVGVNRLINELHRKKGKAIYCYVKL